jgi:DNA repair protein SbcD/Mre11
VAHTVFEYSLPAQIFPGSLSYVALGHLHRPQRIPAAAPVRYSGSPLQLDFGEAGEQKSTVLVEASPASRRSHGAPAVGRTAPRGAAGTLDQVSGQGRVDG